MAIGFLKSLDEKNRKLLKIDENSKVLVFNTEGETDPKSIANMLASKEFENSPDNFELQMVN